MSNFRIGWIIFNRCALPLQIALAFNQCHRGHYGWMWVWIAMAVSNIVIWWIGSPIKRQDAPR